MRIAFLGDLASENSRSLIDGFASVGADVVPIELRPRSGRFRRAEMLLAVARLRGLIHTARPDVLFAYRTTSFGFLGVLTGFRPLVVAGQGETDVWPPNHWSTPLKRLTAQIAVQRADLCHAWGPHIADTMVSLGARRDRILVLPRGIDTDTFVRRREITSNPMRIISTRSLAPDYRIDTLILAVAELAKSRPVELTVIGDGPSRAELESLARRIGVAPQVRFEGRLPPAQVAMRLRASDVYVALPVTEGVSASLLEAMASGCTPVVVNHAANRPWVRHGATGVLLDEVTSTSVAAAIARVFDDEEMRQRAFVENRVIVEERGSRRANMSAFVQRYERLLMRREPN